VYGKKKHRNNFIEMKQTDQHKRFTAIDIQQYHAGELSMQERHALEKAALDDPFLADALEGYTQTATPQADLLALQQRLAEKTTTRKTGLIFPIRQRPLFRAAALLLLLAGAGWAVYQFSFTPEEKMAVSTETIKTSPSVPAAGSANDLLIDSVVKANEEVLVQMDQPEIPATIKEQPLLRQRATPSTETAGVLSSPEVIVAKDQEVQHNEVNAVMEGRAAGVNLSKPEQTINTFKGQIVDPNGNPVPYANIQINGNQNGVTTNTQGRFSLTTPDSVVNATVAAVGFQSNRVNLVNPYKEQKVVLNEAENSLQEVVVVGLGTKKARKASRPSDARTKAEVEELEPEGGWSGFNDYISQNIAIPEEISSQQLKGEVELSFEVDKNGEPVNIKIKKSLCTSCDKEAIRLLKEGPHWKKKKKKAGKVTIRF
jgi:hypothetical protein